MQYSISIVYPNITTLSITSSISILYVIIGFIK